MRVLVPHDRAPSDRTPREIVFSQPRSWVAHFLTPMESSTQSDEGGRRVGVGV